MYAVPNKDGLQNKTIHVAFLVKSKKWSYTGKGKSKLLSDFVDTRLILRQIAKEPFDVVWPERNMCQNYLYWF